MLFCPLLVCLCSGCQPRMLYAFDMASLYDETGKLTLGVKAEKAVFRFQTFHS